LPGGSYAGFCRETFAEKKRPGAKDADMKLILFFFAFLIFLLWPLTRGTKGDWRSKMRGLLTYLTIVAAAIWLLQILWLLADRFLK
jgi:hypothetical protein